MRYACDVPCFARIVHITHRFTSVESEGRLAIGACVSLENSIQGNMRSNTIQQTLVVGLNAPPACVCAWLGLGVPIYAVAQLSIQNLSD